MYRHVRGGHESTAFRYVGLEGKERPEGLKIKVVHPT